METILQQGNVAVLSDDNFDEKGLPIANTKKPIVIAILSENCGWCQKTVPELVKAARDSSIVVAAVNVGRTAIGNHMLKASRSSGVPTFLLFKDGKFLNKASGAKMERAIIEFAKAR